MILINYIALSGDIKPKINDKSQLRTTIWVFMIFFYKYTTFNLYLYLDPVLGRNHGVDSSKNLEP